MADDPTSDPKPDPKDDKPDPDAGAKKALEAERKLRREAEKKANDLEARLGELENGKKGESEKLTEQIAKMQKDLEDERRQRHVIEVAAAKGLTPAHVKRLSGATREELEASADELLEDFPIPEKTDDDKKDPPPGGKPREQLKPGNGDPDTPVEETDIKAIGARMFAH
jgi:hypothetical protein